MAINPVIRYVCDECPDEAAMTEDQAIAHVEMHLGQKQRAVKQQLEEVWRLAAYDPRSNRL